MRDSSTCNVVCLSPGQTYKLLHGCSRHGIPVMRLPEACHVVDFWYFLLSLSIIRTAPPTIPRVIQAWHIYHKTARSVQCGKLLLNDPPSLDPAKQEMASSFSWTQPFKCPTSRILCLDESTLAHMTLTGSPKCMHCISHFHST